MSVGLTVGAGEDAGVGADVGVGEGIGIGEEGLSPEPEYSAGYWRLVNSFLAVFSSWRRPRIPQSFRPGRRSP